MSSSRIASASASTASAPSSSRASARSTPQARFTAVGRAARSRAAPARTVVRIGDIAGQERHAHRTCHAERRRAADGERRDRVDQRVERGDAQHDELVGEAGLVDEVDLAVDPVDRAHDGAPSSQTRRQHTGTVIHAAREEPDVSDLIALTLSDARRPRSTAGRRSRALTPRCSPGSRPPASGPRSRRSSTSVDTEAVVFRARVLAILDGRDFEGFDPDARATSTGSPRPRRSSSRSWRRCAHDSLATLETLTAATCRRTAVHAELGRRDDGRAAQRVGRPRHDAHRPGGARADAAVHPGFGPVADLLRRSRRGAGRPPAG